jgi:outer membrane receptor protein involved in Fe transport
MLKIRTRTYALPLAAALLIAGVTIHSTTVRADESAELDPIQVTAGRQSEPQYQVPQPVTVLTQEQLEKLNPQAMTEALRYEPGAFFQQTGPGQGIVITRGLKGAEVLHLVDGMRLNNAFFRTAPSQYIALLDPLNIDQLELLRGPYATVYGSDAMGGVVQVLTPEYRFDVDDWGTQGGARWSYSSADLGKVGRVYGATGTRNFSVSAGFSFLDFGNRKLAEPGQSTDHSGGFTLKQRVEDTAFLARGYDLKTIWAPAANQELMFSVQYFAQPALPRYNETVPGSGTASAGLPSAAISIYDNDRGFYHLRYRYSAPLAFMDGLEVHLARQLINDDRFDRTQTLARDVFEYNRSSLTGLTAQTQTQVAVAHRLIYGLEIYTDRIDSRSTRIDYSTPGDFSTGSRSNNSRDGFASRFPDGARADSYGLYALDEWRIGPDWLLDVGGRYSHIRTELPQADRSFGATLSDDDLNGSLGLRHAISRTLSWVSNLGRGYRSPNINDLAQVGRRSGNRVVVANFNLKPESVVSLDTGLKLATGPWRGEATVFYAEYKDRITLVDPAFAEGTPECPDDGDAAATACAQNQNIAEATYYGFEGGLRYRIAYNCSARAVLNYTWAEQDDGITRTPGNRVPPLNGQVAVEYRPLPGVSVEPYLFFADRQDRLDPADKKDNRINPNGTPGYAIANLRLGWAPPSDLPAYGLQLSLTNLLDTSYREHGSGIDGAGLGATVTATAKF